MGGHTWGGNIGGKRWGGGGGGGVSRTHPEIQTRPPEPPALGLADAGRRWPPASEPRASAAPLPFSVGAASTSVPPAAPPAPWQRSRGDGGQQRVGVAPRMRASPREEKAREEEGKAREEEARRGGGGEGRGGGGGGDGCGGGGDGCGGGCGGGEGLGGGGGEGGDEGGCDGGELGGGEGGGGEHTTQGGWASTEAVPSIVMKVLAFRLT